jgi:phosphoribosylaminoimidazole-succinocarboxamide synthase
MMPLLLQSELPGLNLVNRGKVRDIYDLGEHLLIVTSDRISAFDVIMNEGIPNKGFVLTQISKFWFEKMTDIIPNHIVAMEVDDFPAETHKYRDQLAGRSMLVKKASPLPVECIVRGYVSGSGWKEYKAPGSICGIQLPAGLVESQQLPEPIFTPRPKPSWVNTTRTSPSRRPSSSAAATWPSRHGTRRSPSTTGPGTWPMAAASSSPTPSSNSGFTTAS